MTEHDEHGGPNEHTMDDTSDEPTSGSGRVDRRQVLAGLASAGVAGLAGCSDGDTPSTGTGTASPGDTGGETGGGASFGEFRGSGALAQGRGDLGGTRIEELPDMSGDLTVYIGGGEGGLYLDLISKFEDIYPDLSIAHREYGTAEAANTIITEGQATPADVFWSVDAGSLSAVAQRGLTTTLPKAVTEPVPSEFHPSDKWVGTAGRARSVPYNTEQTSAEAIPEKVDAFPEFGPFQDSFGWAPTYGAFQAFVTAMRILRGEQATKQWLRRMLDAGVSEYNNEFLVANAVAEGEITAGFANHYYALRVKASRPNAPLDLAFTSDDAGALVNAAGAEVMKASKNKDLGELFIRHLLSAEAQEFFATRLYAYPMIPGVPPVGGLPTIDELNPPQLDLTKLSNIQPTLDLMREVGVL